MHIKKLVFVREIGFIEIWLVVPLFLFNLIYEIRIFVLDNIFFIRVTVREKNLGP